MTTLAPSFFIVAGNKDNHKSLDEFEFQPDPIIDCGYLCLIL